MTSVLRERLRAALNQPSRAVTVEPEQNVTQRHDLSELGGRWFDSPDGPGYVIESVYEAGHAHGNVILHRALRLDPVPLAAQCRDPRIAACSPADFVYVDTETTGLAGAGAMVFLAGVARFENSELRLRQYLLPGPQFEGGLLGGLGAELASAEALVSYNGKSFDLPMLESRYILARARPTFRQLPHLDLLHPNRRLFKGSLSSNRLPVIETDVLGFEREADCPSWEVPERYFRFQRSGDPTFIRPVLRHNAWDVLSLVALAAHLGAVCAGEEEPHRAARAAEYAGNLEAAIAYSEAALERAPARVHRLEAIERVARCSARLGRHADAACWWRRLIAEPRGRRVMPYVELAKLCEHRLRAPAEALAAIDKALELVRSGVLPQGQPNSEATVIALEHRRARLAMRLAVRAQPSAREQRRRLDPGSDE